MMLAASCSSDAPDATVSPNRSVPNGATGSLQTTSTAGVPALNSGAPIDVASAAVLDKAKAEIALTDEQRSCVAARLDADPAMRRDLGDDSSSSKRWPDFQWIASECINTVSFSAEWALAVQSQSVGALTSEQMSCLRNGMAAFSSADVDAIRQAGIEPEKAEPAMAARVDALLATCSVDKATLSK